MDTLVKILLLPFALLGSLWAHYFATPVVVLEGDAPPVVIGETPADDDTATTTLTLAVGESGVAHGLTLTPISVEDSRCPQDVQCVWAGTVTALVRVMETRDGVEKDLDLGTPLTIRGRVIELVGALPSRGSVNDAIDQADYRLTITVSPANR